MQKIKLGKVSLIPKGEYVPSQTYERLDIIEYLGSSYICMKDGLVGITPTNDKVNYVLLAEKGEPYIHSEEFEKYLNSIIESEKRVTEKVSQFDTKVAESNKVIDEKIAKATQEANRAETNASKSEVLMRSIPKLQVEGNPITLDDTIEQKIMDVLPYIPQPIVFAKGSTHQEVRSGKNLLNPKSMKIAGNYGYFYEDEGLALEKGDYVLSLNSAVYSIEIKNFDTKERIKIVSSKSEMTFNLSATTKIMCNIGMEKMDENVIRSAQLEKGSIATDYEKYGKAPTPEHPTEIQNAKITQITSVGKNLIDLKSSKVYEGVEFKIKLKKELTYTLSNESIVSEDGYDGNYYLQFFYDDADYGSIYFNNAKPSTFKPLKDVVKIMLHCGENYASSQGRTSTFNKLQLEIGSQSTQYEPCKGQTIKLYKPIELSKWDFLEIRNNVIGIAKKSKTKTFNGQELWSIHEYEGYKSFRLTVDENILPTNGNIKNMYTNSYSFEANAWANKNNYVFATSHTNLYVKDSRFKDVESFKENLKQNNLKVLYELKNPTFEPLPEADQQAILNMVIQSPNSTIMTDSGITLSINYIADTQKWVLKQVKKLNEKVLQTQKALLK